MARHRPSEKRGRSLKPHDYLEDPVLESRDLRPQQTTQWKVDEEDDTQPVLPVEYTCSLKDFELYKKYPHLYKDGKPLRKRLGFLFPFPFLSLPAELRVEVYRYCLISPKPINFSSGRRRIHNGEKLAVALLRTCQQLKSECREVLYGENQYYFWKDHDYFDILHYLPQPNFNWLKELTMSVPFAGSEGYNGYAEAPRSFERQARHINAFRVDFRRNSAIKQLLDAIVNAPDLRRLNLVIDNDFEYSQQRKNTDTEYRSKNEDAWDDLAALLRIKKSLKVTVTRLVSCWGILTEDDLNQQRLLRALGRRLGIWDAREVTIDT